LDAALQPYLNAPDEDSAEGLLRGPIYERHVEPVARAVIGRRLGAGWASDGGGGDPLDEAFGELVAGVLARLRRLRAEWRLAAASPAAHPAPPCIHDLNGYVAVAAGRACDDVLRRRYPARARLKNRVRYLLSHTDGLASWPGPDGGSLLCGYAAWQGSAPRAVTEAALPADADRLTPAALCAAVFDAAGGPVPLDDLVGLLAVVWRVTETEERSGAVGVDGADAAAAAVADPGADVAAAAERRAHLARLWAEVRELPARQAAALLLNLRDDAGRGVVALLPLLGAATMDEIADVLAMERGAFAALWDSLPLEDAAIASLLGVTRQQVINLRKSARERLARRLLQSDR
jgi:hypothetical protein